MEIMPKQYKIRASLLCLLKLWTTGQQAYSTIAATDGAEIITYDNILGVVKARFYNFVTDIISDTEEITEEEAALELFEKFAAWKIRNIDRIRFLYKAFTVQYDPIENYSMTTDAHDDITSRQRDFTTSVNTDLKVASNTDITESTASDTTTEHAKSVKTAHAVDTSTHHNTDTTTEHAKSEKTAHAIDTSVAHNVDTTAASNSDIKSSINTDITNTEGDSVKTDIRPTWSADNQTTAKENVTHGTKTTTGPANNNYTETTGDKTKNYTQTTADATDNYDRTTADASLNYEQITADATSNYDRTTGSVNDNYDRTQADAATNYEKTTADATSNYDRTSGTAAENYTQKTGDYTSNYKLTTGDARGNYTTDTGEEITTESKDAIKTHGTDTRHGLSLQEILKHEYELRAIDFKLDIIKDFVYEVAYYMEVC